MTGYDVYKRVLNMSGYLNNDYIILDEQSLIIRIVDMINQICVDLKIDAISGLEDQIKTENYKVDALCYGVAMLLSISDNEPQKNALFTQIYNSKRGAVLSQKEYIEDKLPTISGGVD